MAHLYLCLLNGRKWPATTMEEIGEPGPAIGPLDAVGSTYEANIRIEKGDRDALIFKVDDCVPFDGILFGDFVVTCDPGRHEIVPFEDAVRRIEADDAEDSHVSLCRRIMDHWHALPDRDDPVTKAARHLLDFDDIEGEEDYASDDQLDAGRELARLILGGVTADVAPPDFGPEPDVSDDAYITAARRMFGEEGRLEIDGDAKVSHGVDDGAYVQAWVWVPADAAEKES